MAVRLGIIMYSVTKMPIPAAASYRTPHVQRSGTLRELSTDAQTRNRYVTASPQSENPRSTLITD